MAVIELLIRAAAIDRRYSAMCVPDFLRYNFLLGAGRTCRHFFDLLLSILVGKNVARNKMEEPV